MKKTKRKQKRRYSWKTKHYVYVLFFFLLVFFGKFLYNKVRFYYALYLAEERSAKLTNTLYERNRIRHIISAYNDATFGIDISHYQDFMIFDSLYLVHGNIPIEFVILRATMGEDGVDNKFKDYWKRLDNHDFIRGAYHYYRPWENPKKQANSFLKNTDLQAGDLRPVLDIEKKGKNQSKADLIHDIQIWLDLVEEKYDKKPIIYTYYHFYKDNLQGKFDDYPLWLAHYNFVDEPIENEDWQLWQFTENGIIPGIPHKVDLNIFNGERWQLEKYTIY